MWKILTTPIKEEIYNSIEYCVLFPKKTQKGHHKGKKKRITSYI